MVDINEYEKASERGAKRQANGPIAVTASYDERVSKLVIQLKSGLSISFNPQDAEGLENATPADLEFIEISPSGLGIHIPKLDADLYIPALLEGFLGSKQWMASRLGQAGGKAKTPAKTASSRENGRLGGRPRVKH